MYSKYFSTAQNTYTVSWFDTVYENVWLAGTVVSSGREAKGLRDQVGSDGVSKYFPYGDKRDATAVEGESFGTYYRESASGLDYAVNRYYSRSWGGLRVRIRIRRREGRRSRGHGVGIRMLGATR